MRSPYIAFESLTYEGLIVFVIDIIFSAQRWVNLNLEFSEAASEEHERFFVVICIKERDVNCCDVTSLVSIDGGSDHNAVSGNCGGSAVFLLVSGLTSFLAASPLCFSTIFMREARACRYLSGDREFAWTGW